MNTRTVTRIIFSAIASISFGAHQVSAQIFKNPVCRDGDQCTLSGLLDNVVEIVIFMLIPVIILMLVYTGFLFVQAQGNPAKLSEAKKVFVWTLVGAFIILAAEALQEAIEETAKNL